MADRYWVGGTGNWDLTTTNWAASSGGASGASVPTSADNVFFDVNSNTGTGAFTVTMANSPRVCNDLTISGLDGAMTLAGASIGLTVSGSLFFPATNFTRTYTGTTTFNATTTGKTVTTNGASTNATVFNGTGGGWTLGSALNLGSTLTLTAGTFDTGGYSISATSFVSSNANPRTINLNNSTLTLSGSTPLDMSTTTNMTFNAGTSAIDCQSATQFFVVGGLTFYNVTFSALNLSSIPFSNANPNTFNNLTITGRTNTGLCTVTLTANQTINGTLTVTASTAAAYRTFFISSTSGVTRTLTCAAVSLIDVDFRDITIAGAASPASGTRLGDCKGNSGITFPAAKTVYWGSAAGGNWGASGTVGLWSATSGGALDGTMFPLAQDTAVFSAATYPASGSTVSINAAYSIGTIDMSLRTSNTMTLGTGTNSPSIYGNWINGTGTTISGTTGVINFVGRTAQQITSAGKSFTQFITIDSPSGSVTLQDALTTGSSRTATLNQGTLDLQSYTFSTGLFTSNNSSTRTIAFGTGNITCTGTGNVWNTAITNNLTTTGTQVVNVTSTGATSITVSNGALSQANSISYNFTGGTYALTFLGSSSYSARNVNFTGYAGTWQATSTVTIYGNLIFSTGMTLTSSANTLTFGATSGTQQITTNTKTINFPLTFNGVGGTFQLQDNLTMSSTRLATLSNGTLSLQSFTFSTGSFTSSNSNTRTIAFGTGNITCTSTGAIWSTAIITGLTTTGTQVVNITSVGSTAISVFSGDLSEANSISFNFTGGTYALTFLGTSGHTARNVNFTGYAGTWNSIGLTFIYGNLTLSTGLTTTLTAGTLYFSATSGTQQITTNGRTLLFNVNFDGVGGTFQLQDALTMGSTRSLSLQNGTLDLNGKTCTAGSSFATSTGTKNLTFNGGTLVCPAASPTAFYNGAPTGFTTTAGTGTGVISMTSASAKTFYAFNATYNCTINQGGAGDLSITGNPTFLDITNTVQPATISFESGTTTTFVNGFTLSGTAGNLVTIIVGSTSQATLSKSTGTVSVSFCSISFSNATGGATWEALTANGNINSGNNSGWDFGFVPATSNFLMFF
jgi:hypothetical protein